MGMWILAVRGTLHFLSGAIYYVDMSIKWYLINPKYHFIEPIYERSYGESIYWNTFRIKIRTVTEIRTCTGNKPQFILGCIIKATLAKPLLKPMHRWIVNSHHCVWINWLPHALILYQCHGTAFPVLCSRVNGHLTHQQAIICTNADPVHWRIYAALGWDELIPMPSQIAWNTGALYSVKYVQMIIYKVSP